MAFCVSFFRPNNGIVERPKYFPGLVLRQPQNVHAAVLGFNLYLAVGARDLKPPRGTHEAKLSGTLELFEFWDPSSRLLPVRELVAITFFKVRFLCVGSPLKAEVYVVSKNRHRSYKITSCVRRYPFFESRPQGVTFGRLKLRNSHDNA